MLLHNILKGIYPGCYIKFTLSWSVDFRVNTRKQYWYSKRIYHFFRLLHQIHTYQSAVLEFKRKCTNTEHQYSVFKRSQWQKHIRLGRNVTTQYLKRNVSIIQAVTSNSHLGVLFSEFILEKKYWYSKRIYHFWRLLHWILIYQILFWC